MDAMKGGDVVSTSDSSSTDGIGSSESHFSRIHQCLATCLLKESYIAEA